MDLNKLDKLRELSYKIKTTCSMCTHAKFNHRSNWGACSVTNYNHRKHTQSKRQLSIHKNGYCPKFEMNKGQLALLKTWEEFIE